MPKVTEEETSNYVSLDTWSDQTGEWFNVDHFATIGEAFTFVKNLEGRYRVQEVKETIYVTEEGEA